MSTRLSKACPGSHQINHITTNLRFDRYLRSGFFHPRKIYSNLIDNRRWRSSANNQLSCAWVLPRLILSAIIAISTYWAGHRYEYAKSHEE